jgi:hypothetical protein
MPGPAVGTVYGLTEFVELGNATTRGDIGTFDRLLHQHQVSAVPLAVSMVCESTEKYLTVLWFLRPVLSFPLP